MVQRCNNVGVRIYVDILLNHMSGDHINNIGIGGSRADPSNRDYPMVPYNQTHFHPTCQVNDFQNVENIKNCELSGLHDLDQSQEYVRVKLVEMLNKLVNSGVAGFRFVSWYYSIIWIISLSEQFFSYSVFIIIILQY
jgi:alpha-amylase